MRAEDKNPAAHLKYASDSYQLEWSEDHPDSVLDVRKRRRKAAKILAVLQDYYGGQTKSLKLLDVGCSGGVITAFLSDHFAETTGTDIDGAAIEHARRNYGREDVHFAVGDGLNLPFDAEAFDTVVCNQVYEHVPDAEALLSEIRRVLRPGGVCYFAAGNRIRWMEDHYRLPLLSVVPKRLAHVYLRVLGRDERYYENLMTLWKLRRMVAHFEVVDYTRRIIRRPEKYASQDMIRSGTLKHAAALFLVKVAYWLCPTYIWLLRKPANDTG